MKIPLRSANALCLIGMLSLAAGCGGEDSSTTRLTNEVAEFVQSMEAPVEATTLPEELRGHLDRLREDGMHLALEDMATLYPSVADEENAAKAYERAFASFEAYRQNEKLPIENLNEFCRSDSPLGIWMEAPVQDFLNRNKETLDFLAQGAEFAQCRYVIDELDGYNTQLPHLQKIKDCAGLLAVNSLWHIDQGRQDAAVESVLHNLALADSLGKEPFIISQLVRFTVLRLAATSVEGILNRAQLNPEQAAKIVEALQSVQLIESSKRAIAGERVNFVDLLTHYDQYSRSVKSIQGIGPKINEAVQSPRITEDVKLGLEFMSALEKAIGELFPYPSKTQSALQSDIRKIVNEEYFFSATFLPNMERFLLAITEAEALLRLAVAGIEFKQHALSHNRIFPSDADQCEVRYVESLPTDPFTGDDFKVRRITTKKIVLYSVGPDRTDNGGEFKKQSFGGYDVVISLSL